MDQDPSLTGQPLPETSRTSAPGSETAAEQALSLVEIETTLGKKFPDKATALKAIKDTFSYVGKRQDAADPAPTAAAPVATVPPEVQEKLTSLESEVFYTRHPEYQGHEHIIKAMGSNPAEVVESAAFKDYFEKAKVAHEATSKTSVVHSNARIAQTKTSTDEAAKMANTSVSTADIATHLAAATREAQEG